jgi:hypothetical protein
LDNTGDSGKGNVGELMSVYTLDVDLHVGVPMDDADVFASDTSVRAAINEWFGTDPSVRRDIVNDVFHAEVGATVDNDLIAVITLFVFEEETDVGWGHTVGIDAQCLFTLFRGHGVTFGIGLDGACSLVSVNANSCNVVVNPCVVVFDELVT